MNILSSRLLKHEPNFPKNIRALRKRARMKCSGFKAYLNLKTFHFELVLALESVHEYSDGESLKVVTRVGAQIYVKLYHRRLLILTR